MTNVTEKTIINNIPLELRNEPGIYIIRSTANHKVYIGSAYRLSFRLSQHLYAIRKLKHHSKHLQKHFYKYDNGTLSFNLLEVCPVENLIEREQFYLNKFNPFRNNGFNTSEIAGTNRGFKNTEEAKLRMSVIRKAKCIKMSDEFKEARRLTWLGRKHTPEAIENMKRAQANKKYGEDARKNMSLAHVGKRHTEEQKKKISEGNKGKGPSTIGTIVLNTETGIYYLNVKDAANSINMGHTTLHRKLKKVHTNNTSFIIA